MPWRIKDTIGSHDWKAVKYDSTVVQCSRCGIVAKKADSGFLFVSKARSLVCVKYCQGVQKNKKKVFLGKTYFIQVKEKLEKDGQVLFPGRWYREVIPPKDVQHTNIGVWVRVGNKKVFLIRREIKRVMSKKKSIV